MNDRKFVVETRGPIQKRKTPMRPEELTIPLIEKAIQWPVATWEGNCYTVACAIVEAGLIKGRAVYGHYKGPVADTGYWAKRKGQLFQRHGWIMLEDDRIMDPTRWSFEDKEPYIAIFEDDVFAWCRCGHVMDEHESGFFNPCEVCDCPDYQKAPVPFKDYDEGGNEFRAAITTPCPEFRKDAKRVSLPLKGKALSAVMELLESPPARKSVV